MSRECTESGDHDTFVWKEGTREKGWRGGSSMLVGGPYRAFYPVAESDENFLGKGKTASHSVGRAHQTATCERSLEDYICGKQKTTNNKTCRAPKELS